MLINWTLVEQRRAECGLSRATLARNARMHPADLLAYDQPGADDSGLTIGTLKALAAALRLPPAALLRPEPPASQSDELTQIIRLAGSEQDLYSARFHGDGELTRWHDQPAPAETSQPPPADPDAAALLAAAFLAGEPLSPGELTLAWAGSQSASSAPSPASTPGCRRLASPSAPTAPASSSTPRPAR